MYVVYDTLLVVFYHQSTLLVDNHKSMLAAYGLVPSILDYRLRVFVIRADNKPRCSSYWHVVKTSSIDSTCIQSINDAHGFSSFLDEAETNKER